VTDMKALALTMATATLALGACVPVEQLKTPGSATLDTPGVMIDAVDNSFHFKTGDTFPPPFASRNCPILPIGSEEFSKARVYGAVPVRVTYPNLPAPLYGLLAFCQIPAAASGPGSRRYMVQIPNEYVAATDGGRISVVYELAEYPPNGIPNWVLWLSRAPFPQ
jgi:hypothetical protein